MMSTFLTPSGFLKYGGIVLVLLAVVGWIGITNNIDFFQLDAGENVVHAVLGVVALAVAFGIKNEQFQKWLVAAVGVLALVATLYSLVGPTGGAFASGAFKSPNVFGVANLENPADTVLHLVVTVWALAAAFMKQPAPAAAAAAR